MRTKPLARAKGTRLCESSSEVGGPKERRRSSRRWWRTLAHARAMLGFIAAGLLGTVMTSCGMVESDLGVKADLGDDEVETGDTGPSGDTDAIADPFGCISCCDGMQIVCGWGVLECGACEEKLTSACLCYCEPTGPALELFVCDIEGHACREACSPSLQVAFGALVAPVEALPTSSAHAILSVGPALLSASGPLVSEGATLEQRTGLGD